MTTKMPLSRSRPSAEGLCQEEKGLPDMTIITMPTRRRSTSQAADPFSAEFNLTGQLELAEKRLVEQTNRSWIEALSEDELRSERAVEEEIRALKRAARLNEARDAHEGQERRRKRERADEEAFADANAAYQRAASPAARVGRLLRGSRLVSRTLAGVAVVGVVWGSFNVQHLMAMGTSMTDPRYWLAFLYEPIITLPLLAMMYLATTASREGNAIARARILPVELGLLSLSLVLNIGPHVLAGDVGASIKYGVAPLMIAAVVPMHSLAAREFAKMIGKSLPHPAAAVASETESMSALAAAA
ncbi:hypothetical protein ABH933_001209 [Nocardia sp. GP40]|uniref:hypothetical protein n=1 Tax=Nocardia sp. GP40 TaxID=3156268 RepID=UPI003D1DA499